MLQVHIQSSGHSDPLWLVSSDCNGSFEGGCCLKWESCHTASKLCERKQLHNEALTVVNTVNLVTCTAGVPVVYFIVFCGYYITSVLSVIKALLSMHCVWEILLSSSLLPVFRCQTAVIVRIEDPPRFFLLISHTFFFFSQTPTLTVWNNQQHVPDQHTLLHKSSR